MTKAHQKGVQKVNEMKIKVRETNGDHQGYIKWIEKFDFGNLPVEDRRTTKNERKTAENLHGFAYGNVLDELRKCLGLDFLHRNVFFTNFKWSQDTRRVERFSSSLLPLFIGKWGRSLPPSSPRRARLLPPEATAFWRPKWAWLLFASPLFTKYTPYLFLLILFP